MSISKNAKQVKAVTKYQSKMHRFTMLFNKNDYENIVKAIYPLSVSAYIRELIANDMRDRARVRLYGANASNKGSNSLIKAGVIFKG